MLRTRSRSVSVRVKFSRPQISTSMPETKSSTPLPAKVQLNPKRCTRPPPRNCPAIIPPNNAEAIAPRAKERCSFGVVLMISV